MGIEPASHTAGAEIAQAAPSQPLVSPQFASLSFRDFLIDGPWGQPGAEVPEVFPPHLEGGSGIL